MKSLYSTLGFIAVAGAQQAAYAECGGSGYTGATQCISGYTCSIVNQWYSYCVPGSGSGDGTTLTTTTTSTSTSSASTSCSTGGLKWVGVDESGAEWGTVFPGTAGVDYFFPSESAIGVRSLKLYRSGFGMCTLTWSLVMIVCSRH
jgi:endoglucanase